MSRDLLFHFVEGPRGRGWTVLNSQRLWNSSERYWNGSGMFQEQKKRPYQNHCYVHSSNGAERSAFDSDGNIAISRAIQYFPAPLRSVPESLLRSQFQRSGAECFWQCHPKKYELRTVEQHVNHQCSGFVYRFPLLLTRYESIKPWAKTLINHTHNSRAANLPTYLC